MDPIVVPLKSRRRARGQVFQKLQHAIPAVGLFFAGIDSLQHGPKGEALVLAVVEIVTTVLLLGTMARSLRAARRPSSHHAGHAPGVDWVEIWAAGVLFAEAAERWHLTHHIARPTILTALVTLGLGLFHGRMTRYTAGRRVLRIDDAGLFVSARPFRTLEARWGEIAAVEIGAADARLRTHDGRTRRLVLSDLEDAEDVRRGLMAARDRIVAADGSPLPGARDPVSVNPEPGARNR